MSNINSSFSDDGKYQLYNDKRLKTIWIRPQKRRRQRLQPSGWV